MRILAIRGSNLASLAGDFTVDFATEPLASSGIFAITGPTGAGKSTLLDAVCLALFADIPRLRAAPATGSVGAQDAGIGARDARSILRHGAGQGHAEVEFAMPGGGHYRARWEVRRARGKADGNLQNHTHSFERIDTGTRMGGTNTETRGAIAEVIGLTADQFTRAVLLAQGDFEAFIRADANERAALLERLTGSQIYARIGQRAWAKAAEMKFGLDAIRQQITALHGLDDEARGLAEAMLRDAAQDHALTHSRKAALEAEERRYARGRELAREVTRAELAWQEALAAQDDAAPRLAALDHDRAALRLVPLQTARDVAQLALAVAEGEQERLRQAVETSTAAALTAAREADAASLRQGAQEEQARSLAPALDQARTLDRRIAEALGQVDKAGKDATDTAQNAVRAGEAATLALRAHDTAQARRGAAEAWLDTHAALRGLNDREHELGELITTHAATRAMLGERETGLGTQEEAGRAALAGYSALGDALRLAEAAAHTATAQCQKAEATLPPDGALAALSERLDAIATAEVRSIEAAQAAREAERAASALEQTRLRRAACGARLEEIVGTLAGHEVALADGERELGQARRVLAQSLAASDQAAEALRAGLVEGEPCPVCGAAEHPLSALETLLGKHLEENRAQTQALEDALTRRRGDHQAILREREALMAQQAAMSTEDAVQRADLPALMEAATQASAALQHAAQALGLAAGSDLREPLLALRQAASEQRDAMQTARGEADGARRADDAARGVLETARQAEQAARDTLRMRSEAVNDTRAILAGLRKTLDDQATALDRALGGVADWRQLPDAAAWLRHQAQAWRAHAGDLAEAAKALPTLANALGEAVSARDVAATQASIASEALHICTADVAMLRQQRAALLAGRAVEDVERDLTQASEIARQASETARRTREQTAQTLAGDQAALAQADGHRAQSGAALAMAEAAFAEALTRTGIAAGDVVRVAALGAEALEAQALSLSLIAGAVREAQAVLDKCRGDLARHQALALAEEAVPEDMLAAELIAARLVLEDAIRVLEDARLAIRQDDLVRERTADLRATLDTETAKADIWLRLSDLIGDKEGQKFRRFAQGLTLDRLLEHANASLMQLKPRFALERGMGGDMLIQVIDNDMGGRVRGLHNLSGGERFLVSLALALGLAAMSTARGVKIESLFIDEGFGALDPASLGQALALLEHLHATGRRVGVISHVEELKERIAVKIEVKPTGRGTSRIEVTDA